MANKFTRNITNVSDIEKVPKYTNNENDLISHKDGKQVYIRRKKDYHCLTDNVKKVYLNPGTTPGLLEVYNYPERNTVEVKANRDRTKQNVLTVKTDTPETVDISLEKDVLQVDVKAGGENSSYQLFTPIHELNVSYEDVKDGKKTFKRFTIGHGIKGSITSVIYESYSGTFNLSQKTDILIPLHDTYYLNKLFESGNRFKMGLKTSKSGNIKQFYQDILLKKELVGFRGLQVFIDFEIYHESKNSIVTKEQYTDTTATLNVLDLNSDEPVEEGEYDIYVQFSEIFSKFMNGKHDPEKHDKTYLHIRDIYSTVPYV